MAQQDLRIVLSFSPEDQAWLRISSIAVPRFFEDHTVAPATGDGLRVGGRQFVVLGRIWEHDGIRPTLRLLLSGGHAESDTAFGQG